MLAVGIFMFYTARLFELHYFFAEIGRTLILVAGINTISLLYSHKLKKDVLYLTFFLFFFALRLLVRRMRCDMAVL